MSIIGLGVFNLEEHNPWLREPQRLFRASYLSPFSRFKNGFSLIYDPASHVLTLQNDLNPGIRKYLILPGKKTLKMKILPLFGEENVADTVNYPNEINTKYALIQASTLH